MVLRVGGCLEQCVVGWEGPSVRLPSPASKSNAGLERVSLVVLLCAV